jgi:hypothetical protein
MTRRQLPTVAIGMLVACFAASSRAEACICGSGVPLSVQARTAVSVFIGTVEAISSGTSVSQANLDGSITSRFAYRPLATVRVTRLLKGEASPFVSIRGGGECDAMLALRESWLFYTSEIAGEFRVTKCGRSRRVDDAQADLGYFEKRAAGVAVAIAYGDVFRRCVDRDSLPQLCALDEPLEVVAAGTGGRTSVTTDRFGPYQIVLPPGGFEIWVERNGERLSTEIWVEEKPGNGRRLSAPELLELRANDERRVLLIAQFK